MEAAFNSGFAWVRNPDPRTAVVGGHDVDGTTIYVGRSDHYGELLPAKVLLDKNVAYVSHSGQEIAKHDFEVLCKREFRWEFANHGSVPPGAVMTGRSNEGEPLYIGRAFHEGSNVVGKVHQSHGCCYVPFGGVEHAHREYEVLTYH